MWYLKEFINDPKNQIIKKVLEESYNSIYERIKTLKTKLKSKILSQKKAVEDLEKNIANLRYESSKIKNEKDRKDLENNIRLLSVRQNQEQQKLNKLESNEAKVDLIKEKTDDNKDENS